MKKPVAVLLAMISTMTGCSKEAENLPPVELLGEHTGILVWHKVENASKYEVVISRGEVIVLSRSVTDTLLPLPPGFEPGTNSVWTVKAFDGNTPVALSTEQRLY